MVDAAKMLWEAGISGRVEVRGRRNVPTSEDFAGTLCATSARALVAKGFAAWTDDYRAIRQTPEGHKLLGSRYG